MSSDRILIRSTLTRWPAFLLGAIGVLALVLAGVLATLPNTLWGALLVAALAVTFLVLAVVREVQRVRRLMWLSLTDTAFTVTDNVGERTFHDDDIVSMALRFKENFENGVLKSVTRIFRVWIVTQADRPELIEMTNTMKLGVGDPLSAFIDRITSLLKDRANVERERGESVLGEGWQLQGKNLTLRPPRAEPVEVLVEDVVAADYLENQLKLWRKGQDDSFAQLPLDAANCHLLKVLLDEELAKRPETDEPLPPDGSLGRIIFERRPSRSTGVVLACIGGLLFLIGTVLAASYLSNPNGVDAEGFLIGALVLFGLGLLMAFIAWYVLRYLFRLHAYGVYQRTVFGDSSLRYLEVEAFTYSATRHFHNGVYTGTHLSMSFLPFKDTKKPKIVYSTQVKNVDSSLDEMRDQIARILGVRMYQAVLAGGVVPWTPNLTLRPDGVYYQPSGFFGKKPPGLLQYGRVSRHNLHQGNLLAYENGKPKPVINEAISARNFFPGFFAFLALLENPPDMPPTSVESAGDVMSSPE